MVIKLDFEPDDIVFALLEFAKHFHALKMQTVKADSECEKRYAIILELQNSIEKLENQITTLEAFNAAGTKTSRP